MNSSSKMNSISDLTSRELILNTFRGIPSERVPIWFMRQAGRYLPEYMEIRKNNTFEERVQNPEIAAKITLQPIERFDLDAAIIFSDILIPIYGMNRGLKIIPERGPVIEEPVRTVEDIENLIITNRNDFSYLPESVEIVREQIPDKALIGFAGAPFTVASYLLEGKSTRDALLTKSFAMNNRDAFELLMDKTTTILIDQLQSQIDAGADFIQLFDSWAGYLTPDQFREWALPSIQKIFDKIDVPTIFYSRGSNHLLLEALNSHADGFSIDHTQSLEQAYSIINDPTKLIQGNLDPAYLLSSPGMVSKQTNKILSEVDRLGISRYIFNLGQGINKNSSLDNVSAMVNEVKSFRRNMEVLS